MPAGDDLDDLIDSYVADALRATGLPADKRSRPSPSYAPPIDPIEAPEPEPEAVALPARTKAPTPTGVAKLAAELFDDLADEVAPPPPPAAPTGVSIRFSKSLAVPLEPSEPPLSELYTMPALPGLVEPAPRRVPDTLPGIGPQPVSPGFASELPTDPDGGALATEPDDEPTNVVSRFPAPRRPINCG